MNLRELFLETDVREILGWLREGVQWWLDEIAQMAPRALRERMTPRTRLVAWTDGSQVELRDTSGTLADPSAGQRRVDAQLAPNLYLTRTLDLPAMRIGDLKKLVELELDRLTPFRNEDAVFDVAIGQRHDSAGTQTVRIGVLPRRTAEQVGTLLAHHGYDARSLRSGEGFDFLPAVNAGVQRQGLSAQVLWLIVATLFLANAAIFIERDTNELSQLQELTESQRPVVTLARRLREKVDAEATARAALLARKAQNAPLPLIDAVTAALPATAWVQRFEWDGHVLHLAGYGPSGVDVAAELAKTGLLRAAKATGGRALPASGAAVPFDVTIPVAKGGGR